MMMTYVPLCIPSPTLSSAVSGATPVHQAAAASAGHALSGRASWVRGRTNVENRTLNIFNLAEFVNREVELGAFDTVTKGSCVERVLIFSGPLGIGKSALVQRLCSGCRERQLPHVLIDFERSELSDVELLVDQLAAPLGDAVLAAIDAEIAAQQTASSVPEVGQSALTDLLKNTAPTAAPQRIDFRTSEIGAGAQVAVGQGILQISHSQITLSPGTESLRLRQRRLLRLGRAFRQGVAGLLAQQPVILFFDGCEEATQEVQQWLQREVLEPLLRGEIAPPHNLAVILSGDPQRRRGPWVQQVAGYGFGVLAYELANLLPDAVHRYWVEIKGLKEELLPPIFRQTGAPPDLMRRMADLSAPLGGRAGG